MITNPFTPRSGLEPKVFVNREKQMEFFNGRLDDALQGRCQHYVITGSWGIGKTSLLKQLKLAAQTRGMWSACFPLRCFSQNETPLDFAAHLIQMTAADLPIQPKPKEKLYKQLEGLGLSALSFSFQANWKLKNKITDSHLVLKQGLLALIEHVRKHKASPLVLLIDDIQNIAEKSELLTLLRNVFTDPELIKKENLLVVLSCTENSWAPFLKPNHPIGRLFMPRIRLLSLDEKSTNKFIKTCLKKTGIVFDDCLLPRIYQITKGHPFEIHAICEALFEQQVKNKVSLKQWDTALNRTLLTLGDAEFTSLISLASEQELRVLTILARCDEPIELEKLKRKCRKIKSISEILSRLYEKNIVNRVRRGVYFIEDRLFANYILKYEQQ